MSRRSHHFRFLALVGIHLLFLAGVADAMGGKACPHHAHGDAWHGPSSAGHSSEQETLEDDAHHTDHAHHGSHEGHGEDHADHGASGDTEHDDHDAPECDCGFLCTSVTTPLMVQVPQVEPDVSPFLAEIRLLSSQDYDGNLDVSSIHFFLPYSNGPPAEA